MPIIIIFCSRKLNNPFRNMTRITQNLVSNKLNRLVFGNGTILPLIL